MFHRLLLITVCYAKHIIEKLGTEFGYGVDLGITSSEFSRQQKVSEYMDAYITQKERLYGSGYTTGLQDADFGSLSCD